MIGAGILGSRHARVYAEQSDARLLAGADSKAAKAREVAEKYNARWFTDYHEMIGALGPAGNGELQAVSVATPDHLHVAPVRDCLLAGREIFVEKPLTMSVVEANELIVLARERSRVLVVNLRGTFLYCRAVLPAMRERRRGTIINVASITGIKSAALCLALRREQVWRRRAYAGPYRRESSPRHSSLHGHSRHHEHDDLGQKIKTVVRRSPRRCDAPRRCGRSHSLSGFVAGSRAH